MPAIETLVRELPATLELKPKAVFAALRLGMSGQTVTPGLFESLWVLGRDNAVARLEQAAALPRLACRRGADSLERGRARRRTCEAPLVRTSGWWRRSVSCPAASSA